tara:strand:+ start:4723 stop:4956 length:234 start_codon:yes stop_codon:yes gene_type:complete
MKKSILILFLLFNAIILFGQQRKCGTMENLEFLKSQDSFLEQKMLENEIDLVKHAKCIYFLEIETDKGVINKKLILQ